MTTTHHTAHRKPRCWDRVVDSFWMPSQHHGELIDPESVEWTSGTHCTAFYRCPCCDVEWSESGWPVVLMLGIGWSRRYTPPIRLVAGEGGVPRHLASAFTAEGLLAAPTARMTA
jgi:hypothetical protein